MFLCCINSNRIVLAIHGGERRNWRRHHVAERR